MRILLYISPITNLSVEIVNKKEHDANIFLISEEEICRRLLERDPEQITQKTIDKFPVLHYWAIQNKLWPFEVLLRSDDIVPNVRKIFVDLMSSIDDKNGFTPLHILAVQDSSSEENVEIAKLLIETCKQEVESSQMSRTLEDIMYPWLMEDNKGFTPLFHALDNKKKTQSFAIFFILSPPFK